MYGKPAPRGKFLGMRRAIRLSSVVAVAAIAAQAMAGDLIVKFINLNGAGAHDAAHTYVTFGGGGTGLAGQIIGGGALVIGQSYPMTSMPQGVKLQQYLSGRVYISYGAGLNANAGNAYNPNFANPSLPDYGTRWDKIELTWNGTAGGANLTAQDFFGIPLRLKNSGGSVTPVVLTWNLSTSTVMNSLGALSGFSLNALGHPQGALVTGPAGVTIAGVPNNPVVRVISPATVTPTGGSTVYPSMAPYIAYLRNNGGQPIATNIAGNNGMIGPSLQTYDLQATVRNAAGVVGGASVQPGDLVFTGTVNSGGGNVATTFVVHAAEFNDFAIYGCNAPFTMAQGANTNSIVQKALGDYFAGLNFGLIGSNAQNPMNAGHTIGASPSWTWYGNKPNGINQAKMNVKSAFKNAQPSHKYYNTYAEYLVEAGDAYGFPFNDRLQAPLASLAVGSTLEVAVLKDALPALSLPVEVPPAEAPPSSGDPTCDLMFHADLATWQGVTSDDDLRVTFEEPSWPVNTSLSGPWTVGDITMQGFAGTPSPNVYVADFGSPFGTGKWLTANGDESIDITPSAPVRAIAFNAAANALGSAFVNVYGAGNELLGSLTLPVGQVRFVGITSGVPITRVNFSSVLGAQQDTGLDNIRIAQFEGPSADLNHDGIVDGADLGILLGQWSADGTADLNCDDVVDGADLGILLGSWSS